MSRPPLVENMEETRPSELRELFDAVATEVPPFFGTGETHDRKILGFQSSWLENPRCKVAKKIILKPCFLERIKA